MKADHSKRLLHAKVRLGREKELYRRFTHTMLKRTGKIKREGDRRSND
jgi:hypothetical protein